MAEYEVYVAGFPRTRATSYTVPSVGDLIACQRPDRPDGGTLRVIARVFDHYNEKHTVIVHCVVLDTTAKETLKTN